MKTLTILGRRWFRKTYGNTYTSAQILIDGQPIAKVGPTGGYGDYYLQIAFEYLDTNGLLIPPLEHHANGSTEAPWQWAERAGVTLHYSAVDVARERDL